MNQEVKCTQENAVTVTITPRQQRQPDLNSVRDSIKEGYEKDFFFFTWKLTTSDSEESSRISSCIHESIFNNDQKETD